jgi:hypothetical protein
MVSSGLICRATELTTPMLTEFSRPSGLPNAITSWPWWSASESPSGRGVRSLRSTRTTARSVSRSTPTTVASSILPEGSMGASPPPGVSPAIRTRTLRAFAITWALVTI